MQNKILDTFKLDDQAVRIGRMWSEYSLLRSTALAMSGEVRQYINATSIDTTSANNLDHKNRTHQPKITQIRDILISKIWNVCLSKPNWFDFKADKTADKDVAQKLRALLRKKLEQKRFRTTVGRKLVADFVDFGNAIVEPEYKTELNTYNKVIFRGSVASRIGPLDIVFNPILESFEDSPKIQKRSVHISNLYQLRDSKTVGMKFFNDALDRAIQLRQMPDLGDFETRLKSQGLSFDGYSGLNNYLQSDYVEMLIYRGDIFDLETQKYETNKILMVVDKMFVLATMDSNYPLGRDGLSHGGARIRTDNLWYQSPLDNLIGLQYRIDKLENAKADMVDLIVQPPLKIKGDGVQEPIEGYKPGANYYMGIDEDVSFLVPDTTALSMDTQIALYHRLMEDFAGVPPESRGVRTPGEKTKFEVDLIDNRGAETFTYYATNFEDMLVSMLEDMLALEIQNMTGKEEIEIFDDLTNKPVIVKVTKNDLLVPGKFVAIGASHWDIKRQKNIELQTFSTTYLPLSQVAQHISGLGIAESAAELLEFEDDTIVSEFAGLKEQIEGQAVSAAKQQQVTSDLQSAGVALPEQPTGDAQQVQPRQG